jgi:putative monooxygenase
MQAGELRKVASEDVEPHRRQGGEIRILLSPLTVGATAGFGGTLSLDPGDYVAEQYHPYTDKFIYLVRGRIVIRAEGAAIELNSDEAIMIRRGQRHRIENHGQEAALAVFHGCPLAPSPDLGHVDTEPVPNPGAPVPRVGGVPVESAS